MRVLTHILRKPNHVQLGTFYRIVGTASTGLPLPPQVYCPQVRSRSPMGMGYFSGKMFLKVDMPVGKSYVIHYDNHPMPFWDINDDGKGERFHDFHLEFRDSNKETIEWAMGDDAYKEIVKHMSTEGVKYNPTPDLWNKANYG